MVVYNKQSLKTAQSPDATESEIEIGSPDVKVIEMPKPTTVQTL